MQRGGGEQEFGVELVDLARSELVNGLQVVVLIGVGRSEHLVKRGLRLDKPCSCNSGS